MNTFQKNLKDRINGITLNIGDNIQTYLLPLDRFESYMDIVYRMLESRLMLEYITTKYIIVYWSNIKTGDIDIYNVHDDYIELAVKLNFYTGDTSVWVTHKE